MTCHELFFVFGDLYVPGTQDAEVTKSLCVVPEISISTPLRQILKESVKLNWSFQREGGA